MTYVIDDNNVFAISVFSDGGDIPFLYQPTYPNGDIFGSHNEADKWAKAYEVYVVNPNGPFPPQSKEEAVNGVPAPVAPVVEATPEVTQTNSDVTAEPTV